MGYRLAIDISSLSRFLKKIGSYSPDLIFNPGPVKSIKHYTNLEGLLGIINDYDLWLTHSRYSNDAEELTHGYRIVKKVIQEQLNSQCTRSRRNFLKEVRNIFETTSSEGVYICCFCQDDNLLSQWRGYGASGSGVCLSFKPTGFSYITGPDSPPRGLVRLWKVFYKPDTQRGIVKKALNFAFSDRSNRPTKERARKAADAILFFIPTFKNQDFEEENEVRLIFTPEPDFSTQPQFRVSRGMLTPYYSLNKLSGELIPTRHLPLTGIRVGPSISKDLNVESIRILLTNAGYKDVEVESSDTPFRG